MNNVKRRNMSTCGLYGKLFLAGLVSIPVFIVGGEVNAKPHGEPGIPSCFTGPKPGCGEGQTNNPIMLGSGAKDISAIDIPDPLGMKQFGISRIHPGDIKSLSYTGQGGTIASMDGEGHVGGGWFFHQWPYLYTKNMPRNDENQHSNADLVNLSQGRKMYITVHPHGTKTFVLDGSVWKLEGDDEDISLIHDSVNHEFVYSFEGGRYYFRDFYDDGLADGDNDPNDDGGFNGSLDEYDGYVSHNNGELGVVEHTPVGGFLRYEDPSGIVIGVSSRTYDQMWMHEYMGTTRYRGLPSGLKRIFPNDSVAYDLITYEYVDIASLDNYTFGFTLTEASFSRYLPVNGQYESILIGKVKYEVQVGMSEGVFFGLEGVEQFLPNNTGIEYDTTAYKKHAYRYYADHSTGETPNVIRSQFKYVMNPDSYRALVKANSTAEQSGFTSTLLDNYSDYYFEYDQSSSNTDFYKRAITKEVAKAGCGSCSGSSGTTGDGIAYISVNTRPQLNISDSSAQRKTAYNLPVNQATWTRPGAVRDMKLRTNVRNQPVYLVNKVTVSSQGAVAYNAGMAAASQSSTPISYELPKFYEYDSKGRKSRVVHSSSINTNSLPAGWGADQVMEKAVDGSNNPITDSYGNPLYANVKANDGIIERYEYSTHGKIEKRSYQKGQGSYDGGVYTAPTEILSEKREYESHYPKDDQGNVLTGYEPVVRLKKLIKYPDADDQLVQNTTEYQYVLHENSTNIKERITILPTVMTDENGSGAVVQRYEAFDRFGNLTWRKDENGVVTYIEYDPFIGKPIKKVIDPIVSSLGVSEHPSWVSSSYAGLHQEWIYEYDHKARLTYEVGPEINSIPRVTRYVYIDGAYNELDQIRVASGYGYAGEPYQMFSHENVKFQWISKDGKRIHKTLIARDWGDGGMSGEDTVPIDIESWTENFYNDKNQLVTTRVYHDIPMGSEGTTGDGQLGVSNNYLETYYEYDAVTGKKARYEAQDGTVTRYVYDELGYLVKEYVGTDDTGATSADPSAGGASNNDMCIVAEYEYDNGTYSDEGQITKITRYASDTDKLVTVYDYDWLGRRVVEGTGAVDQNQDGNFDDSDTYARYTKSTYDNIGRNVQTELLDKVETTSTGTLLSKTEYGYDARGRKYRETKFAVNPDTGVVGNSLSSNYWYDDTGNVIKSRNAGDGVRFAKIQYDDLGRQVAVYSGYDNSPSESAYPEVKLTTGDTILTQTQYAYNIAGQLLSSETYSRKHDDQSTVGALDSANAHATYLAYWYDQEGNRIASANYGDNDGAAFTRSASVPSSTASVLVSSHEYNTQDIVVRAQIMTDPEGVSTKVIFNDIGQKIYVIENYQSSTWNSSSNLPMSRDNDVNRATKYTYTAGGKIKTITAIDPNADGDYSDDQVTTYVYGTTLADSDVASNTLLTEIQYPDSEDANDRVKLTYDRFGRVTSSKDQRGVKREFERDILGRLLLDKVTEWDSAVDGSVESLSYGYNKRGLLNKVLSYDNEDPSSGSLLNENVYLYNDFGQLTSNVQTHDGSENGIARWVSYEYEDGSDTVKGVRLKKITYPNGRGVHYLYSDAGDANGLSHYINRITSISGNATRGTDDANVIVSYERDGDGRVIAKAYPKPQVRLDFAGSTGDEHLDRFSRINKLKWERYDDNGDVVDDIFNINHAYDRASNRLYADRVEYPRASHLYSYDDLHRLKGYEAGTITGLPTSPDIKKVGIVDLTEWKLDQLGNQLEIKKLNQFKDKEIRHKQAVNKANEYEYRKTLAGRNPRFISGFSSTTNADDWDQLDTSDQFVFNSGGSSMLEVTSVAGSEATILLAMPETGQSNIGCYTQFPTDTVDGAEAGFVFGYKSADDYWLYVRQYNAAQSYVKLYHVENGVKNTIHSYNTTVTLNSKQFLSTNSRAHSIKLGRAIADGYPAGRVGLYTTQAGVKFDTFLHMDSFTAQDFLGRWANYSLMPLDTDGSKGRVRLSWSYGYQTYPLLMKGSYLDDFETTFSFERKTGDTYTHKMQLIFGAKDINNFKALIFAHNDVSNKTSSTTIQSYKVDNGGAWQFASGTYISANYPDVTESDKLWVRVQRVNGVIEVRIVKSAASVNYDASIDSALNSASVCYTVTGLGDEGGQVGLLSTGATSYVDDFLVRTDSNGDGTFDRVEHFDDFEVTDSYAQNTYEYDAAGNMTFDGVYAYTYDAWNRMTQVYKAHRNTLGNVENGALVQSNQYDALGKRIIKQVHNSDNLDNTYHYYYEGMRQIEVRDDSDEILKQNVWGLNYVDEIIQSRTVRILTGFEMQEYIDTYALQDANYNVLGIVNEFGTLAERYEYTPYGERTVFTFSNTPGYAEDQFWVNPSNPNSLEQQKKSDPKLTTPAFRSQPTRGDGYINYIVSLNEFGHQGLMHDENLVGIRGGLIYNRARMLNPAIGRFMQRDPLGYIDGISTYQYLKSSPVLSVDPYGLSQCKPGDYQIFNGAFIRTKYGYTPEKEEEKYALTRDLLARLNYLKKFQNPAVWGKRLQRWGRIGSGVGNTEDWFWYGNDWMNYLFNNMPSVPLDVLIGEIPKMLDFYDRQRKLNHFQEWYVVLYKVCDCTCAKPLTTEWSDVKKITEEVQKVDRTGEIDSNMQHIGWSRTGNMLPRKAERDAARRRALERIKEDAKSSGQCP
ncbi:RHS repeat-associated core domain-containing protein [Planctomycetota bacterium]|nr:RHS repeat-associated core domain-containing protein [Planctomycetota bacterium]